MHLQASKAALINFYDTFRVEFGTSIMITIATPGLIESGMTRGKYLAKDGEITVDQEIRDVRISYTESCDSLTNSFWYMW